MDQVNRQSAESEALLLKNIAINPMTLAFSFAACMAFGSSSKQVWQFSLYDMATFGVFAVGLAMGRGTSGASRYVSHDLIFLAATANQNFAINRKNDQTASDELAPRKVA